MASLTLQGSTSGQITLATPAVAGTNTITLPAATGTVLTTAGGQTISGTVTLSTLTSPAATALTIQSAGTTAMTIDTSQNVGIGTASPVTNLTISSASAAVGGDNTQYVQTVYTGSVTGPTSPNSGYTAKNYYGTSQLFQWNNNGTRIGNRIITNGGSGVLAFTYGNDTEGMRIDSSGNVGIGTTSPSTYSSKLAVVGGQTALVGSASSNPLYLQQTGGSSGYTAAIENFNSTGTTQYGGISIAARGSNPYSGYFSAIRFNFSTGWWEFVDASNNPAGPINVAGIGRYDNAAFQFYTNNTERARIDSSGNLLVGKTTTTPTNTSVGFESGLVVANGYRSHNGTSGSTWSNAFNIYWTGSAAQLWIDASNVGNISLTSDYRIKKNVETQTTSALNRISQLRPVTYTYADNEQFSWKADGVQREGFIAHELQEVIPSAVNGEKDAENQVQSLQLDALCSVLVKAIQELKAELDALKGAK